MQMLNPNSEMSSAKKKKSYKWKFFLNTYAFAALPLLSFSSDIFLPEATTQTNV